MGFMPTAAMAALDQHRGIKRQPLRSDLEARDRALQQSGSHADREAAGEIDDYQAWLRKHGLDSSPGIVI